MIFFDSILSSKRYPVDIDPLQFDQLFGFVEFQNAYSDGGEYVSIGQVVFIVTQELFVERAPELIVKIHQVGPVSSNKIEPVILSLMLSLPSLNLKYIVLIQFHESRYCSLSRSHHVQVFQFVEESVIQNA